MTIAMPAVWTDLHRLHTPNAEVWLGVPVAALETPARADVIHDAVVAAGAKVVPATEHPGVLARCHDPAFLAHLESAHERWTAAGYGDHPGQDQVVPYVFPLPQTFVGVDRRMPVAQSARAGWYAMDTTTPLGAGTYRAAVAAADCALTAVDLVLDGIHAAYAVCRPPGHHAGRDFYGGSCYLNNAALAAEQFRAGGAQSVGIVDLDAHHGNGTQSLFYQRRDVTYTSIHVDPDAGWFPHFVGRSDETGAGPGAGANLNVPLPEGAGDDAWLAGVDRLIAAVTGCDALVVSLGVDGHAADPESPLVVSEAGHAEAARRIGALRRPTVLVQEGGYDLTTLAGLVVGALAGFERGWS